MTVRANKPAFSIREKLKELQKPIGLKGSELMRAETAQEARDFVSAGRKNLVINGDMRIDQRNNGASVTRATTDSGQLYILDRWDNTKNSNSKAYTIQRSGTAPVGFTSSLLLTITSTNGTNSSTDYNIIRQFIEGYNVADLMWGTANAKPIAFSFWTRSSVTGTYAVCFTVQNGANYPATYTINSANTWEYKTITVPGPTSGTWATNNTAGLGIYFDLGVGSQYSSTTNTWTYGGNLFAGTGVTKLTETNGATWYITGVQLEVGKNATEFEHRSYGEEISLCHRYYWKTDANNNSYLPQTNSDGYTRLSFAFPTEMRIAPTVTATNWSLFSTTTYCTGYKNTSGVDTLPAVSATAEL